MELDDQNFCWSLPLTVHTFAMKGHGQLKGRLHLARITTTEKKFGIIAI